MLLKNILRRKKKMSLETLWAVLENEKPGIKLKDAVKRAKLEWYSEYGGGNDELVDFIHKMKRYQTKKFIKKVIRNSKYALNFAQTDDFYHLYLLRKAKHPAIEMLFGVNSTFKLLNWESLYDLRKKESR